MQRDAFERNGNYSAVITMVRDGKPITLMHSLRTRDKSAAEKIQAKVNYLMTQVENGEKQIPAGVDVWDWLLKFGGEEKKVEKVKTETTLDAIVGEFLQGRTKKAPNTQSLDQTYVRHLRRFLAHRKTPFLPVADVSADLFGEYKAFRYAEGVGVKTVNMELAWFSKLCKDMRKYFPSNPLMEVDRDKNQIKFTRFRTAQEIKDLMESHTYNAEEQRRIWKNRILTEAEIVQLLRLAKKKDEELFRMISVAGFTGARRSEIARLRWLDIDFRNNQITITGMKGSQHDQFTSREFDMHPELVKALKAQKLVSGRFDYVFPGEDGKEYNPKLMHKRWLRLVKGTPFEKGGRWHMARHSLASILAASGEDQRVIDGIIGHSTRQMAMKYQHMMPEQKKAAAKALSKVKIG